MNNCTAFLLTSGRVILAALPVAVLAWLLIAQWRRRGKQYECVSSQSRMMLHIMAAVLTCLVVMLVIHASSLFPAHFLKRTPENYFFEMDVHRVTSTITAHWVGNYRTKVHPLQCLIFQPAGHGLVLLGLYPYDVARLLCALALLASAGIVAATIYISTRNSAGTIIFTAAYVLSFGFLLHLSIPESGALAAPTVALPYFLLAAFGQRELTRREKALYVIAGIFTLTVTITNVLHSFIAYFARLRFERYRWRKVMLGLACYILVTGAIGICLAKLQQTMYPGSYNWYRLDSVTNEQTYTHLNSLTSPQDMSHTIRQVLIYTMAGLPHTVVAGNRLMYDNHAAMPLSILVVGVTFALAAMLLYTLIRLIRLKIGACLIVGISFNVLLHFVYGDKNLLIMYAGNWLPLIYIGCGIAFAKAGKAWKAGMAATMLASAFSSVYAIERLSLLVRHVVF